jgi:Spy/CpxP family protein refolding chaperone
MNRIALVVLGALAFPLASNAQRLDTPRTTATSAGEAYIGRGVLEGIELTREQKSALSAAVAAFSAEVVETFGKQPKRVVTDADSKKMSALRDGLTVSIRNILTPAQRERFNSNLNALAARRRRG